MNILKTPIILIGTVFLLLFFGYLIFEKVVSIESQNGYQGTFHAEVTIIDKGYNKSYKEYWVKGIVSHLAQDDEEYNSTYFIVKEINDWEKLKINSDYVIDYYIIEKIKRDEKYIPILRSFEKK